MASSAGRAVVGVGSKAVAQHLVTRNVKPIQSADLDQARFRVKAIYKKWMRYIPEMIHFYRWYSMSESRLRLAVKQQFVKNSQVADPRAVDVLAHRAEVELYNTRMNYNQSCHLYSTLFGESLQPKPKDFLSKFFAGKNI